MFLAHLDAVAFTLLIKFMNIKPRHTKKVMKNWKPGKDDVYDSFLIHVQVIKIIYFLIFYK